MNKYVDGVMNYTGSKYKLLPQLLPEMDYSKPYFVDLFCGGGSVYTNVVDKYDKVLANDIINELIGIHKGLIESDSIIDKTKILCSTLKESQKDYLNLRESYNQHPSPDKLWALILSCNSNLIRFNQSGLFNQTWGKRSWNKNTDIKVDDFIRHIRKFKDKLKFTSKSFNDIVISNEKFMIYIDPPYGYIKDDNGEIGKKQISEAGYNSFYYQKDDIDLYNYCHKINKIGSSFMISGVLEHGGQTSWLLSKLIGDGFNYKELSFNYEKISKSNSEKGTREIIIKNF